MSGDRRDGETKRAAKAERSVAGEMAVALPEYRGVLNLAGTRLPCAVVRGPRGIQRVLSETSITNAILGGRSGASRRLKRTATEGGALLPVFAAPKQLIPFVDATLDAGALLPVEYRDGERVVRAYDASVLPAVCNLWLRAREAGALTRSQLGKAQKAEILMRALAETGIVALVDEATGYEVARPQRALQAYLDRLIRKELAAWAKKFPDEFYENIYRLKGWTWPGMQKNRFGVVAAYTRDLVYERLGPGVLEELERKTPKNDKGWRPNKLHQWFTDDVGDPMLAQHLHALLMFQRLAIANGYGWRRFLTMVDQVLPKKGTTLLLPFGPDDDEPGQGARA